jgi:two-component system, chemotaxis family, CheB/CheR fusion protein
MESEGLNQDQPELPAGDRAGGAHAMPIVGIGGSAGGLKALQSFFQDLPSDTNMAYLVILHLSPEHESNLAAVLQSHTSMPVMQVNQTTVIQPNHVYVIPPTKYLSMSDGSLRLSESERPFGRHVAIDLLFRTLAEARGAAVAAVLFSGTGSDGTGGMKRVKELGGVTFAQDLADAEYDSMPCNAIATSLVDYVLPVDQMPVQLLAYVRNAAKLRPPALDQARPIDEADALREVFALLRVRTGHDFSNYKRATMLRRIGRRLQVHGIAEIGQYVATLRERPGEIEALLRDLLISVTNFFRDRGAFDALEAHIPKLLAGKSVGDQVRVWVAGCATGEEAYSVAMLLREHISRLEVQPAIQIFATDIDEDVIAQAREGLYTDSITADVSPERLQRFFTHEQGHYRVKKEIRDLVLFAAHNLLRDPPFSKLDLLTCRNLLIYLDRQVQEQLFNLFHFVLRPEGLLLLGASEFADNVPELFGPLDKQNRLFIRHPAMRNISVLPSMPLATPRTRQPGLASAVPQALSFGDLHLRMLEQYAAASVLRWINLVVRMIQDPQSSQSFVLVIFDDDAELEQSGEQPAISAAAEPLMAQLERELQHTKDQLRATVEQYETSIEELRASNEELQAINEELRSTTEELETSKEELQSINEELRAVNQELKNKIDEVSRVNNDLQNFLSATDIGTIFLNRSLQIMRYTPQAEQLFNLIPSDINRPLAHVTHRLSYAKLEDDAAQVIARLTPIEREVQRDDGLYYLARLLPYRSADDRIDGVVLTFVDITERKRAEQARLESRRQTELILESISDAYMSVDHHWRGVYANQALEHLLGTRRRDVIGKDIRQVYAGSDMAALFGEFQQVMETRSTAEFDAFFPTKQIWVEMRLFPTSDGGMAIYQRDITERKRAEERLHVSEERLRLLNENMLDYAIIMLDTEGRFLDWNAGAQRIFGFSAEEMLGQPSATIFTPEDRAAGVPEHEMRTAIEDGSAEDERWHLRKDGSRLWVSGVMTAMRDENGTLRGFAKVARDATERIANEELGRRSAENLERAVRERTSELARANSALQGEIAERSQAQAMRNEVTRQLITAEERERQRISRELHDQMGQQLTALLLGLQALKDAPLQRAGIGPAIEQLQDIANQIGREVHQLALELRPTALDDLGLAAALANYSSEWAARSQVQVNFHSQGLDTARPALEIETTIYRVVLEALNNVARHAQARLVSIILERRGDYAIAIVEDDGRGFDAEAVIGALRANQRLGLLGIRERLAQVGGTLTIESTPGAGTTVIARIPLPAQSEG